MADKPKCPQCASINIKRGCCGKRSCGDCRHKWRIKKKIKEKK